MKVKMQTSCGALAINEAALYALNLDLGFGGVGGSGQGRLHGQMGFNSCSNLKSYFMKTGDMSWPANCGLPPYTPEKQSTLTFLLKHLDLPQETVAKRFAGTAAVVLLIGIGLAYYKKKMNGTDDKFTMTKPTMSDLNAKLILFKDSFFQFYCRN